MTGCTGANQPSLAHTTVVPAAASTRHTLHATAVTCGCDPCFDHAFGATRTGSRSHNPCREIADQETINCSSSQLPIMTAHVHVQISLMEDQVQALMARNIAACFLGSAQNSAQVKADAWAGKVRRRLANEQLHGRTYLCPAQNSHRRRQTQAGCT